MKNAALIAKILTALAALVGVAYIIATYGEQIVAWAKKLLASCPCNCNVEVEADVVPEAAEEAAPAAEEPAAEEPAVEEVVIEEHEPVAEETDFEE